MMRVKIDELGVCVEKGVPNSYQEMGIAFNFFLSNFLWPLIFLIKHVIINPFHTTGLFQQPLKTSENQFSEGIERGQLHEMG